MKKLLSVFLLAALISLPAQAQVGLTSMFPGPGTPHASGGSYTGPGDVVASAMSWWGLRAYNASQASAHVKALQVCTASDALCTDIHVTSSGGLNSTDLTNSGCSSINTCTVKFLYDQSGANSCNSSTAPCDVTNATIANRPTFMNSCIGSLPCLVFLNTSSQELNAATGAAGYSQPFSTSFVADRTGNASAFNTVIDPGAAQVGYGPAANEAFAFYGSVGTATATDSATHAVQSIANGASSTLYIDGTSNTVNAGTSGGGGTPVAVGSGGGTNFFTGNFFEGGSWGGTFSGGNLSSMNSNQHAYWGF